MLALASNVSPDTRFLQLKPLIKEVHHTVRTFWHTHGAGLQSEHGPGTFKHDIVVKMDELYQYIAEERDTVRIHSKILDILGEQSMHMIQFQSCLDEFNRYLTALRRLDTWYNHTTYPERSLFETSQ